LTYSITKKNPNLIEGNPRLLCFEQRVSSENEHTITDILRTYYSLRPDSLNSILGLNNNAPTELYGHFLINSTEKRYHLAVKPLIDYCTADIIYELTKSLLSGGVLVPLLYQTVDDHSFANFSYKGMPAGFILSEFIEQKPFSGSESQFLEVARALSRLHSVLRNIKIKDIIILRSNILRKESGNAKKMIQQLATSGNYDSLYELGGWARKRRKVLERIADEFEPRLSLDERLNQPVHGDLHPGNISFRKNEVVFLDLETVTQNYLPVTVDLAKAMFRLYLMGANSGLQESLNMFDFLKTYWLSEKSAKESAAEIQWVWKQIIFDNISCSLYACSQRRYLDPEEELDKFCGYLDDAEKLCGLMLKQGVVSA